MINLVSMRGQLFLKLYYTFFSFKITKEYNNIDEALRLGFNWSMGPFEMLEAIGLQNFSKIEDLENNNFLEKLKDKNINTFYDQRQKYTDIETLEK